MDVRVRSSTLRICNHAVMRLASGDLLEQDLQEMGPMGKDLWETEGKAASREKH